MASDKFPFPPPASMERSWPLSAEACSSLARYLPASLGRSRDVDEVLGTGLHHHLRHHEHERREELRAEGLGPNVDLHLEARARAIRDAADLGHELGPSGVAA